MSNLDKLIPFKRREKKDISLSRITTETINLANYQESNFGINTIKSLKKRNNSFYAKKLLTEILPDMVQEKKSIKKPTQVFIRTSTSTSKKKKVIFDFLSLDRINEYDHHGCKIKYYTKTCNLKKHLKNDKFISNFLTPVNNFISSDFNLYNDDYNNMTRQIPIKKHRKVNLLRMPIHIIKDTRHHNVKQCKFKI